MSVPGARQRGDLERVLDAAERRARELLGQASKYEGLGQAKAAQETLEEHYRPLRESIDRVRTDAGL